MAGDKALWVRENLPTIARLSDDFAAEFGRENFRVVFASEGGHVIGQPIDSDGVKLSETCVGLMFPKKQKEVR